LLFFAQKFPAAGMGIFSECVLQKFVFLYSSGSQTFFLQLEDCGNPIVPVSFKHCILAVMFTSLFWEVLTLQKASQTKVWVANEDCDVM